MALVSAFHCRRFRAAPSLLQPQNTQFPGSIKTESARLFVLRSDPLAVRIPHLCEGGIPTDRAQDHSIVHIRCSVSAFPLGWS